MITVPFSIQEVCDSGEELLLSAHAVCERVVSLKHAFRDISTGIVALLMERSSQLVCAVVALVELHIPFIIVQQAHDPVSLGARWIFDGEQVSVSVKLFRVFLKLLQLVLLRERFSILSTDVILCSTSFCFDPSIVELFLSFTSGARLLLVPDRVRSQPHLLASILKKYKPTVVQLTPSVLSLLDEATLSWIFGDLSPIRCLLIGGERFPLKLVRLFRTPSNPTRIFDVYGITEVSCWATVAEISHKCNHVAVGTPLRSTLLSVSEESELLIGGTRRCCVNGTWSGEFTATGDVVEEIDGHLVIVGRTDDQTLIHCRFEASPAICGEFIVIGGYDGGVYFLSADTGAVEWRFTCGDVIKAACAVEDNQFVYVPAYNRKLFKINPKSRECVWSCDIRSGSPANAVIVKKCILQTTIKGSVEAIDALTGMHLWIYQVQAPVFSSVTAFDYSGFIGSVDGMITKLSLKNGKKDIATNVREPIFASVSISGKFLYIVTERGSLFIADLMLRIIRHFSFPSCSFVVPVISISHTVLGIISSSGLFIMFSEDSGIIGVLRPRTKHNRFLFFFISLGLHKHLTPSKCSRSVR
ncbi:hypothetical protein Y032_0142g2339 [Ancylostoma ceylanicum]|uniref:Uncharacterized protein n=1 Tax=Ancylostoma ceylanicum TaxID=53326 RepID=A0A016T3H9_9BILA|nr:hypothetical protein Y032_0142g2339 [Ancylostoma ceylanicum]